MSVPERCECHDCTQARAAEKTLTRTETTPWWHHMTWEQREQRIREIVREEISLFKL